MAITSAILAIASAKKTTMAHFLCATIDQCGNTNNHKLAITPANKANNISLMVITSPSIVNNKATWL